MDLEFSVWDYAVFGLMLAVSFGIGIYHAVKSSGSNEEYLMGGHSIGVVPMAISLCASFNSAYMILGIPSEMYTYGTQFYIMILGTGIGVFLAAEMWVPVLYKLKVVSIYEYFELRYNSKIPRLIMTVIFILKTTLYTALVVYAPTIALSAVSSISWWACVLLLGISSTVYTTLGGMKAIVWTDVFQIFIMYGGILAIFFRGLSITGGLGAVWEAAEAGGRLSFFDTTVDPFQRHSFWTVLFGTIILWGSPYLCSQYLVHRCICLETQLKGKLALYLNYVGQFTMTTLVAVIGLILYKHFIDCDPVLAGVVGKRDAVIPLFVLQQFQNYYGVPGVFISCLFSGALSTLDSALHSLAAVTWEEVKELSCFKGVSAQRETQITKALSVAFGLLATALAFAASNLGSLISLGGTLFGACMGPMFAFTLISVLCPYVNLKGSVAGLVFGQLINIWLSIGSVIYKIPAKQLPLSTRNCSMFDGLGELSDDKFSNDPNAERALGEFADIYRVSYFIFPIVGFVLTAGVGVVLSLAFGGDKDVTLEDERLFTPCAWRLYRAFKTNIPRSNKVKSMEMRTENGVKST